MAITENVYTGNGSTLLFSISFPYLNQSDVKVTVNGTLVTNYSFANTTTIQFGTAPASGAVIRIYRQTDDSQIENNFFAGASIKANDLNEDFNQALYLIQEKLGKYGDTMNDTLDMGGNKITGLADPDQCTDAVPKCWLEDNFLGVPEDTALEVPRLWISYHPQNTLHTDALNSSSKITQDLEGNSYQASAYKLFGSGNPVSLLVTKRNALGVVQWSKHITKAESWQQGYQIVFNKVNNCIYLIRQTSGALSALPQRVICLNGEGNLVWAKDYTIPAHPTLEPGSNPETVTGENVGVNPVTGHVYIAVKRGSFYIKGGGIITLQADGTVASFNWYPLSHQGAAQAESRTSGIFASANGTVYVSGHWIFYPTFFGGDTRNSSFLFEMNAAGTSSQSFRIYGDQHRYQANYGNTGYACLLGSHSGKNLRKREGGDFVINGTERFFIIGSNYTPVSTFIRYSSQDYNIEINGTDSILASYLDTTSSTVQYRSGSYNSINSSNQIASGRHLGFNNPNNTAPLQASSSLTQYDLNVSTHQSNCVIGASLATTTSYTLSGLQFYSSNNTYLATELYSAPSTGTPIALTSTTNPPVADSASVSFYIPVLNNGILITSNISTIANVTPVIEAAPSNIWVYAYTTTSYTTTIPLVPTSASYPGTPGNVAWDANYIYFCTATNSWKRIAFTPW